MTPLVGRPPKPPGEAYSIIMSLRLTPHQKNVVDALVEHDTTPGFTAQQLIRDLIRGRYLSAIHEEGMPRVTRNA